MKLFSSSTKLPIQTRLGKEASIVAITSFPNIFSKVPTPSPSDLLI